MKNINIKVILNSLVIIFAFCIIVIFLFSCGGGSDTADSPSTNTGSIVFSLEFLTGGKTSSELQLARIERFCAENGIATVKTQIFDENNEFLVEGGPWPCEAGEGTVTGVEAGDDRTIVTLAEDDSEVTIFRGEMSGITVEPGEVTDAGTIVAIPFVPTLSAPEDGSTVTINAFSLNWDIVENADEYNVLVSEDSSFDTKIIDDTTTDTEYTPSGLSELTTYYWKVFALDIHENQGADSEVWSFTTEETINEIPTATISAPTNGDTFTEGDTITFSGTGYDTEDGTLTGDSLVWTSSIDGQVGTGASFATASLSAGNHTITLTATDFDGATGTDSVSIIINPTTDTTPPTPNPMTWADVPYETSKSSISMKATTASDPTGPITYYFDFYDSPTGGSGVNNSGWQSNTTYSDSGLGTNHEYGYRVKARDGNDNETSYSSVSYDYTDIETPSGIDFGTITNSSIQAKSSNTPSGLTRGSSGLVIDNVTKDTWSGWNQDNNYWTSGSLSTNTRYGFRAAARNGDGNDTSYCSTSYRYTLANSPGSSSFSNVTETSIRANWTANGNPSGTEYWCERSWGEEWTGGWTTNTYRDFTGLTCGTSYSFRVTAINGNDVDTGWTDLGSQATEICDDIYEDNDSIGTAYDITSLENTLLFAIQNDSDWYKFLIGEYAYECDVNIYFIHNEGDLNLELYNSVGNLVSSSTSSTDNEDVYLYRPAAGTYYIRVYGLPTDDTGNEYDLIYRCSYEY